MQELIDNPLNVNPRLIENWKEVSDSETYMLSMFLYKFSSFLYAWSVIEILQKVNTNYTWIL